MKIPSFLGGTDEQRSKNLSDNQLINLYPVTNNDGSVAAFYKVDGLKNEGTLSGVPTGAYKSSNGRAFYTSGTVLYELTVVAGVYTSTSRGTITTADNYEFSDNGLEMILVNGTDGWIFTFSDNSLLKLTVLEDNFTVQAATAADADAILTKTAHGLTIGDIVILTTTGALPSYLLTNTPYYVLADGFTADTFKVGLTLTGATCTISNGTPCTVTSASHGFLAGDKIRFLTTGALPSPLVAGTIYYVISAGITQDTFRISLTLGGVAINTTTAGSGVHSFNPAITIIQGGLTDCNIAISAATGGACTISLANPAIVTKATHGLLDGDMIVFYADYVSFMPTGISEGLVYYVIYVDANTFKVSLTKAGTAAFTTVATSGTIGYKVVRPGTIVSTVDNNLTTGDAIKLSTTGALPTGYLSDTDYFVSGLYNATFFAGGVGTITTNLCVDTLSQTICNGSPVKFTTNGTLPAGLEEGRTYYIKKGFTFPVVFDVRYEISETLGGTPITAGYLGTGSHTIIELNSFGLVATAADVYGTRITASGTQSGTQSFFQEGSVAYGTHTYSTGGSGFPNGAKTISYMNGRFIACAPNTQDFYVSEVLDGKTWDAFNVQTVDSNPDYVFGQIVSHNELFVFCENSGETYYDSGTTPTPFVRNLTGIFEVGCKHPYTIREVGNSVFFLGNTKSGNGIVYQMSGLTPVRISTYSIEYQIQQMSDISDARAFTYQKDGHHYYVLTFPTGDKTFVFDASTSMWHERSQYSLLDGITWILRTTPADNDWNAIAWNGTLFAAVSSNGTGNRVMTSPDGIYWTVRASAADNQWRAIAWNGTVFAVVASSGTGNRVMTSPDGITWTIRTSAADAAWRGIAWNGTVFAAVENSALDGTNVMTSPDGITWTLRTAAAGNRWYGIAWNGTVFAAVSITGTGNRVMTSPDGITWTSRTSAADNNWEAIAWNGTVFAAVASSGTGNRVMTSPDGITWTIRVSAADNNWTSIAWNGTIFAAVASSGIGHQVMTSPDGITWTLGDTSATVDNTWSAIAWNDTVFAAVANSGTGNRVMTSTGIDYVNQDEYLEWPVNKYLYFNDEHLTTDYTTTLFSIDSATYKNGTNDIRVVRSFRAPPSEMKRVAHHSIQVDCEVGIGDVLLTEPVIALRWSDDAGNTWSTPIERGLGLVGDHSKSVIFRRRGSTKGLPRIYELSCDENVKITLLDCYLE